MWTRRPVYSTPSAAGPGTHDIIYTIAGACGDADTVSVIVTSQLDASITPVGPFCESDAPTTLTAADAGGVWSATCGACINGASGDFDPVLAGPGLHTITYGIAGNCGDTQTVVIDVLPDMNATITPVGPFCIGNAAVLLTAVDAGGTWSGNGIVDPANRRVRSDRRRFGNTCNYLYNCGPLRRCWHHQYCSKRPT